MAEDDAGDGAEDTARGDAPEPAVGGFPRGRRVAVDWLLAVAFVAFAGYFYTLDDLLVAGVWVVVAAAFAARAAGLLPHA